MGYRVVARVREVRGRRAVWYQPGGAPTVERFYIREAGKGACLHALAAILTLLDSSSKEYQPQHSE